MKIITIGPLLIFSTSFDFISILGSAHSLLCVRLMLLLETKCDRPGDRWGDWHKCSRGGGEGRGDRSNHAGKGEGRCEGERLVPEVSVMRGGLRDTFLLDAGANSVASASGSDVAARRMGSGGATGIV
jgi:hypothetical protein